jgi:glycosyltransferase involved in cell wall biosynthesis
MHRPALTSAREVDRRPLRILQVGTNETGGGAAAVANALHHAYRSRGCASWLAVGQKSTADPDVFVIPDDRRAIWRATGYTALQAQLRTLAARFPGRGWGLINRSLRRLTHPRAWWHQHLGIEDFEFPGTDNLLDLVPSPPDILHCHNLHGGYFDLRALSWLSARVPTAMTLHDTWALAGHCAYSLGCDRWKTGCGSCPDLRLYPAVPRDATAENWRRKRDVYARSRLYVAAPSQWLIDRVGASMLAPAVIDARVIPHGVDLKVFRPADQRVARSALGLPLDAHVILLTAGSPGSAWKDRRTLAAAMAAIAAQLPHRDVVFVALDDGIGAMKHGRAVVRHVGYQADPAALARCHQAADLYLHATRADTFPTMVLEALACGTPVVATSVGGIPEQVVTASLDAVRAGAAGRADGATGVLVAAADAPAMASAAVALLEHGVMRMAIGENAARDARVRFDRDRQVDDYLAWYHEILDDWRDGTPRDAS